MVDEKKVPNNPDEDKKKIKTKKNTAPKIAKEEKAAKEPSKKAVSKNTGAVAGANKDSFVSRTKKFLRGAFAELKKVHWPGRADLVKFTAIVLVAVAIVAVGIFAVDNLLSRVLALIITK